VDECSNGGRMIRGPVKTFKCECKEGYKGELCEKGTVLVNHETNTFNMLPDQDNFC
jgi:hypothetical protein